VVLDAAPKAFCYGHKSVNAIALPLGMRF
jgi:hypothetical protein